MKMKVVRPPAIFSCLQII